MKIGVLGGSFDPIHLGHVALGEAAVKEANLDKLIIMPANIQPFKQDRSLMDEDLRLEMAKLAFSDSVYRDKIEVSDYEIKHTEVSYTVETLEYLQSIYKDSEIYFVMGTDSFLTLNTWHRGEEILEKWGFLVSSRPGYREEELEKAIRNYEEKYDAKIITLKSEMPNNSSTMIRELIQKKMDFSEYIPEKTYKYIKEKGLYK